MPRPVSIDHFKLDVSPATLLLCAALALGGCGGGGGHDVRAARTDAAPQQAAAQVSGHAAVGAPLAGARLSIADKDGHAAQVTADDNGAFTFPVGDFAAPLRIIATDPLGVAESQIVVLVDLPAAGASMVANVTPLTTAIAAGLSASGNPFELADSAALAALQPDYVEQAQAFLRTLLADLLSDAGVPADVDFIAAPFVPGSHGGLDRVLDDLRVSRVGNGVRIVNVRRPDVDDNGDARPPEAVVLNRDAVTGTQPPAFAAIIARADVELLQDSLTALADRLRDCIRQKPADRLESDACRRLAVPAFLDNGYGFEEVFDDFLDESSSVLARAPATLYFVSRDEVLVELVTGASIADRQRLVVAMRRNSAVNTRADTWEITGDQSPYNAGLIGYVYRTARVGGAAPAVGYRSSIGIYYTAAQPNPAAVATVAVTGPGLPPAGLVLAPSPGNSGVFFIANKTGQLATTSYTGEQLFHVDATREGSLDAPVPWPTSPVWADAPMSPALAQTLAGRPVYEFTLYDAGGNWIDSFERRLDTGLERAASGGDYPWSELDAATYAQLTPPAAAAGTLSVGWTRPAFGPAIDRIVATGAFDAITAVGSAAPVADSATVTIAAHDGAGAPTEFPALADGLLAQRSISLHYRAPLRAEHVSEWRYGDSQLVQFFVNPFAGQGSGVSTGTFFHWVSDNRCILALNDTGCDLQL